MLAWTTCSGLQLSSGTRRTWISSKKVMLLAIPRQLVLHPYSVQLQYPEDSEILWRFWCFWCMLGYSGGSIVHQTLTWTTGSLTCVCDLLSCVHIYIHSGALSFSHIQRTWVESAQNLTPEIASVFLCAHALFLVLLDHLVREKNMCLECESIQHLFSFQDMFVPFVFFLLDLFWFLPLLPPPSPANPHPALLLPIHIIPPPIIP